MEIFNWGIGFEKGALPVQKIFRRSIPRHMM